MEYSETWWVLFPDTLPHCMLYTSFLRCVLIIFPSTAYVMPRPSLAAFASHQAAALVETVPVKETLCIYMTVSVLREMQNEYNRSTIYAHTRRHRWNPDYTTLDPERRQHNRTAPCYCPAVFSRHLRLTALPFPQKKIGALFKNA